MPAGPDLPRLPPDPPLPEDPEILRLLLRWCEIQSEAIRVRLAAIEDRQRAAAAKPAGAGAGPGRGPKELSEQWIVQYTIGAPRKPMLVHTPDCGLTTGHTRPITRAQALELLTGHTVEACGICGAERHLGVGSP
ncbi:DUF6233 domain-containing protein [Streptomyces sp. NPDC097619]|uniref:DUF6233 domain-containing protein n=1 Tax=Streptomyces sp. NPDC097619 TaxID=3157228 RepID=UPI003326D80A